MSPQTELYLLFRTGLPQTLLGITLVTDLTLAQLSGCSSRPSLSLCPLCQGFLFNLVAFPHSVMPSLSDINSSLRDTKFFKFHENRPPGKEDRVSLFPLGRNRGWAWAHTSSTTGDSHRCSPEDPRAHGCSENYLLWTSAHPHTAHPLIWKPSWKLESWDIRPFPQQISCVWPGQVAYNHVRSRKCKIS